MYSAHQPKVAIHWIVLNHQIEMLAVFTKIILAPKSIALVCVKKLICNLTIFKSLTDNIPCTTVINEPKNVSKAFYHF